MLRDSDGTPYGVEQPSLVVFITDGEPTGFEPPVAVSSEEYRHAKTPPTVANDAQGAGPARSA